MGFFDKIKSGVTGITAEYKKLANKTLMEGTIASCALVINANGIAKPEEKRKMLGFIKSNEQLKVYDTDKVINTFNKYFDKFDFDPEIAKGEILQIVAKIKNPDEAQLLVRVLIAIGAADGDFDANEKNCVRDVIRTLGLMNSDFGL
ncbi:MAG TPA: tellurite resistance TerB family protein [Desulfosporosinus sp.]|nr:tellurite resistance TerB family protein [Desulfosporosinus sp.]